MLMKYKISVLITCSFSELKLIFLFPLPINTRLGMITVTRLKKFRGRNILLIRQRP